MSKHTPGPWLHDTSGHPNPDVRAASGRAVAVTWMVCKSAPKTAEGFNARQDEDRANARLIAASPCLLEALRTAADHLEGMPDPEDVAACVAKARAAIAKAEGA